MSTPRDELAEQAREKMERAEESDPAARAEALEDIHRSLEDGLDRADAEEVPDRAAPEDVPPPA
jgi:hypothetical protein